MTLRIAPRARPVPRAVLIVATLAAEALLSGYVQVLDGAVRTGELRRVASDLTLTVPGHMEADSGASRLRKLLSLRG